jgi:hypothetical protein
MQEFFQSHKSQQSRVKILPVLKEEEREECLVGTPPQAQRQSGKERTEKVVLEQLLLRQARL